MTLQEFQRLQEIEQLSMIMESGILMSQHVKHAQRVFVYSIHTFYVSAVYNIDDDQLMHIHCYAEIRSIVPEYRRQFAAINPAEREYEVPEG